MEEEGVNSNGPRGGELTFGGKRGGEGGGASEIEVRGKGRYGRDAARERI